MSTWTHHRAQVASLSRSRAADDPDLIRARQSLRAARLEAHIEKALADAPPLTDQQLERIARLLAPTAGAA